MRASLADTPCSGQSTLSLSRPITAAQSSNPKQKSIPASSNGYSYGTGRGLFRSPGSANVFEYLGKAGSRRFLIKFASCIGFGSWSEILDRIAQ